MHLPIVHVPLTAKGFAALRAAQWSLVAFVIGTAAATSWFWWESRGLHEQAAQYESGTRRVQEATERFIQEAAKTGADLSEARLKTLAQEVSFTNHMLKQRAFSWTRFLSDLEEAVPPRISIRSVTLSATDATIALAGSALTLKDVTALVTGLESHPAFRNVVLSQHRVQEPSKDEQAKKPSRPTVDFAMTVHYRPPL